MKRGPSSAFESPELITARYLAEVCHELRSPVAVISLVTELSGHADKLDAEHFVWLMRTVRAQAALLRTLIDRYLEHAALLDGDWQGVDEDVDVASETAGALDSLVPLVPSERVRRQLDPARVVGDPSRVRSIVTNLVQNAVKYSPDDAPVDVGVSVDGSDVVLQVLDRGIGIPVDERDRIMKPFQQASNAREQAVSGLGLGLAIVATHVAALDGRVRLTDRPGGGTIVTVRLPASETGADGG